LKQRLTHADQYTTWKVGDKPSRVLIIDTIGLLGKLYRYGDVAFIGGGFGAGIHNTLEAAVYGIPVVFGPKYEKFREAVGLKEAGAAFSVEEQKGFDRIVTRLLKDDAFRRKAGENAKKYVDDQAGATEKILKKIL